MINGAALIGAREQQAAQRFVARDAASGATLDSDFSVSTGQEVADACALAESAFAVFSETSPEVRAGFLEALAQAILDIGDALIVRTMAESGLPRGRLEGERGRTVGQLRLFAEVVRRGDWIDATIDTAQPDRAPAPRPDLRRRNVAVGPVAVFGASNFPLAFSTAGGDTASAFAAGCPVVVKGHPAHPGAGELVARAIAAAVRDCGLPEGVFSFLPGDSHELGAALVSDPRIKSVGFTGSRRGGLALATLAQARPEPIPVHAEMSSINPVVLLPHALASRAEALAAAFAQSLTLGAGQFCTNPGLVLAIGSADFDRFFGAATEALTQGPASTMLTGGILAAYREDVTALAGHPAVTVLTSGEAGTDALARPALLVTDSASLARCPDLAQEVFGAAALLVRCADAADLRDTLASLEGQLTATIHFDPEDEAFAGDLLPVLELKAGRVLANGWPTGVEVSHAMVHGGPFPATTDARTTSVGTLAMARFLRPICYQNLPDALLPPALRADNPFCLIRRIDGVLQSAS